MARGSADELHGLSKQVPGAEVALQYNLGLGARGGLLESEGIG